MKLTFFCENLMRNFVEKHFSDKNILETYIVLERKGIYAIIIYKNKKIKLS